MDNFVMVTVQQRSVSGSAPRVGKSQHRAIERIISYLAASTADDWSTQIQGKKKPAECGLFRENGAYSE